MSKQNNRNDLPDAPDSFNCSITYDRMKDPVFAADGHSYERSAIEEWFKKKATSPKTGLPLDSTTLLPNYSLQTQINDWVDDQLKGRADQQILKILTADLVRVSTSKEAQVVVQKMIQLITSSNFCLLSPDGVERLKEILDGFRLLNATISSLFDLLASQCQSEIKTKQERHRELNKKCVGLDMAKATVTNKAQDTKKRVTTAERNVVAATKKVRAIEMTINELQKRLEVEKQAAKDAEEKQEEAEDKLIEDNIRVVDVSKLCSEFSNEREDIERQLESVESDVDGGSSSISASSSSSSLSLPAGSKRGHTSLSSSSSSSSTTRGLKRSKKEKDGGMDLHPGQWLFEEGRAHWDGMDFKMIDKERSQLMIEASASSGFPLAVAFCLYFSWNGLKHDVKKAFDMLVKIEKETNGYHWAQVALGRVYDFGIGVDVDEKKTFECYSLSVEQGNSVAMHRLGVCYHEGIYSDVDLGKAFDWYLKSANLGFCLAMYNVGVFYENGWGRVSKDLIRAKEWYTKSLAQGHVSVQENLDSLNAQFMKFDKIK